MGSSIAAAPMVACATTVRTAKNLPDERMLNIGSPPTRYMLLPAADDVLVLVLTLLLMAAMDDESDAISVRDGRGACGCRCTAGPRVRPWTTAALVQRWPGGIGARESRWPLRAVADAALRASRPS